MEKVRIFERKCLRPCLNLNRSAESDYTKYVSNLTLYNKAKVPRIDNFMLGLMRKHFLHASKLYQNSLIFGAFYPNPMYHQKTLDTGYIPPEAFTYLDQMGYLQDEKGIPIIYHFPRRNSRKKNISSKYR